MTIITMQCVLNTYLLYCDMLNIKKAERMPSPCFRIDPCSKGLVTNYGEEGLQNGRGEVLPLRKRGGGRKKF